MQKVSALTDSELSLFDRMRQFGVSSLNAAELVAAVIDHVGDPAVPLAEQILLSCGGLSGIARLTAHDLNHLPGIDGQQAVRLLAIAELIQRVRSSSGTDRTVIHSSRDAATLLDDMRELKQEQVRVLLLDNQRRVTGIITVYIGTMNTSVWRAPEVFRDAVVRGSAAVILAHNHPDGSPQPSPEDVSTTRSLIAAGALLDIPVLDHMIIGHDGWVSLRDLGLI